MRLPETLKLQAHDIPLLWDDALTSEGGEKLWGKWDRHNRRITLDSGLRDKPGLLLVTFLHEVGHALCDTYSVTLTDDDLDRLCEGFAAVLLDNKLVQSEE